MCYISYRSWNGNSLTSGTFFFYSGYILYYQLAQTLKVQWKIIKIWHGGLIKNPPKSESNDFALDYSLNLGGPVATVGGGDEERRELVLVDR